jgi:hypothetical protein
MQLIIAGYLRRNIGVKAVDRGKGWREGRCEGLCCRR